MNFLRLQCRLMKRLVSVCGYSLFGYVINYYVLAMIVKTLYNIIDTISFDYIIVIIIILYSI